MSALLETAQYYREKEISIFPIEKGEKKPLILRDKNGHPIQSKDRKTGNLLFTKYGTPEYIRQRWQRYKEVSMSETEFKESFYNEDTNVAGVQGLVSKNFTILDIDYPKKFDYFLSNLDRKERDLFYNLESQSWVIQSARGKLVAGKRHIGFRTPYPLLQKRLNRECGFEILTNGYSLLPPSIFYVKNQGLLYTFLNRPEEILQLTESELEALSFLHLEEDKYIFIEKNQSSTKPFGLTQKFFEILFFGHYEKYGFVPHTNVNNTHGVYHQSRSEAEYQIVLTLNNQSWSFEHIYSLFKNHASQKSKFKQLGSRGFDYLHSCYKRSTVWLRNNKKEIDKHNNLWLNYALNSDWTQSSARSVHTKSAVLHAIHALAIKSYKNKDVNLSIRQVAETASVHRKTANKYMKEMREEGIIELTRNSDLVHANEYELPIRKTKETSASQELTPFQDIHKGNSFSVSRGAQSCNTHTLKDWGTNDTTISNKLVSHDTFRHFGLGKNGLIIWDMLNKSSDSLTWKEIAMQTRIGKRTVFRKLAKMQAVGMVTNIDYKWMANSFADLDKAAQQLGTSGKGELQKYQHQQERKANNLHIALNKLQLPDDILRLYQCGQTSKAVTELRKIDTDKAETLQNICNALYSKYKKYTGNGNVAKDMLTQRQSVKQTPQDEVPESKKVESDKLLSREQRYDQLINNLKKL